MPHASDDVVRVAEVFATVARSLADLDDLSEALEKIVHLAVDHLEACEFAGISLVEKRTITSPASSNDLPKKLDEIQSEAGEGPCIDAIKSMRSSRRATSQRAPLATVLLQGPRRDRGLQHPVDPAVH